MMPDGRAGRRAGYGMSAADLVAGQCTNRCAFGSAGRFLVVRVGGDCQSTHESECNDECAHDRVS
jgi:hypothetical protein